MLGKPKRRNTITGKHLRDPHPSIGTSVSQTSCITQTSHRLLTPESVEVSAPAFASVGADASTGSLFDMQPKNGS
jgi:hypothetical protein